MNELSKALGKLFKWPKRERKSDPFRKIRPEAKKLAAQHDIEIERFPDGGYNVWPPKGFDEANDPYDGDHFAEDWSEVHVMVTEYVKRIDKK